MLETVSRPDTHPTWRASLDAQRAAFAANPFPAWAQRRRWLQQLGRMLEDGELAICAAIHADFGCRPEQETQLLELFPSREAITHALRHAQRWMHPQRHWASRWFLPARTELLPQPLGVVGIIVPWNYPLYLAIGPIADALAAGNRVMVKMSEYTPNFSALFAQLVAQAFPDGEVSVVTGDAEVGRAFAALPFDHLLFTGSTAVGRHVMRAAAENLTPVTLELGGKSPAIIGPDARFEHAVERIVYGKCVNAGQTCIAPDYVLLPRTRVDAFIATARRQFARMYPDPAGTRQYASVASDRHWQRLKTWRDEAVQLGAQMHEMADVDASARIMPLTVLTDVDPGCTVMREEIFGPLLPLVAYDSFEQALDFIDTYPHPLALYLFDDDRTRQREVLRRHRAGGVSINDVLYHIAQHRLPFGGIGASGMGAYHGEAGFRTFSKMKPVFRQARWNAVSLLNPPYGPRFERMMRLLLRR